MTFSAFLCKMIAFSATHMVVECVQRRVDKLNGLLLGPRFGAMITIQLPGIGPVARWSLSPKPHHRSREKCSVGKNLGGRWMRCLRSADEPHVSAYEAIFPRFLQF